MTGYRIKSSVGGFTLIELMVALGIVAILVALFLPAYNDYTVRSKITECVNEAAVAKLTISEFRQTLGAWPPNLEDAGLLSAGTSHYCAGLSDYESSSGEFSIDINEAEIKSGLSTIAPVLTPYMSLTGVINWVCTRGTTDEDHVKYLPSTCRGT